MLLAVTMSPYNKVGLDFVKKRKQSVALQSMTVSLTYNVGSEPIQHFSQWLQPAAGVRQTHYSRFKICLLIHVCSLFYSITNKDTNLPST